MQLQVKCVTQVTEANSFVTDLKIVHKDLRMAINDAQRHYQVLADKRRSPAPKIEIDDHVFILAKFIKLSEKYLGPYKDSREIWYSLIPN